MSSRILPSLALAALLTAAAALPAQAAEPLDFTLKAAIGGALPHASKDSYFVTTLAGDTKDSAKVGPGARLPFSDRTRTVFDPRPQLMLGGSLELGHLGSAAISLDGLVGAGTADNLEETQAIIVLSGLRLVF